MRTAGGNASSNANGSTAPGTAANAVPSPASAAIWPQACVDGLLVYATGPWGIACVNARTTQILQVQAWPQPIAGQPPGAAGNSAATTTPVTGTFNNTYAPSEGYQPKPFQSLTGIQIPNATGQYTNLVPMITSVQQGMFIASLSPTRIASFLPPPSTTKAVTPSPAVVEVEVDSALGNSDMEHGLHSESFGREEMISTPAAANSEQDSFFTSDSETQKESPRQP